ncbi:hypothetical protein MUG84_04190 [Paenibacillus sp. KQZ6P-2]|uniref:Uncharacterized protein n=1 Tax=Paenibacillus mangrovi TaxID=2931978 RepID=A0A9X1WL86_9BACL|nr:hypothetical protein [Paenibacillus mangrovi]MCJ8010944.1 hypothetical protein [Paenibacillus mangrovi]
MPAILKHNIRKYVGMPLALLAVISMLFSAVERQGTTESYEMFVLRMLTDHYLLIYAMTPIFIFSVFRTLEEDTPFLLVRSRKFVRYFYTKYLAGSIFAILFVLLQVLVVMITGIGLPLDNAFLVSNEEPLFTHLEAVFGTPVLAAVCSCLYMMVGLAFLCMSILTIYHFFGHRIVTGVVLAAYGIMALSIKIPALGALPFITLNRYVILHHNFTVPNGVWWSIAGMVVLLLVQWLWIRYAWYCPFSRSWKWSPKGLLFYYAHALWTRRNFLWLVMVTGGLTLWMAIIGGEESVQDYMLRFFYGQELGTFHLLTFLQQLIFYGTPLYVLALFMEKWSSEDHLSVFIRIKHKKKWPAAVILNGIGIHAVYTALTFGFLIMWSLLMNKSWTAGTLPVPDTMGAGMWPVFALLKMMEFSLLFLALFLLFLWLKNITAAYLLVMGAHALNLIAGPALAYNPAGLVTVSRLLLLEGQTVSSLIQVFTVLVMGLILLLFLVRRSYPRFFQ